MAAVCFAALSAEALGAGGQQARRAARPVTLEWVGDIALSTQRGLPPGGLGRALAPVAPQLRDADLTLGNLEGTLSVGGSSKCGGIGGGNCFAFQAPPATAPSLAGLGFDLVNMVAFVGFAPYASDANLLDIPAAQALVRRALRRASLVVVIIHAGAEGASALHTPHGSEFFVGENRGKRTATVSRPTG